MQEKRCNQQLTMRLFLIISLLFVYTVTPAKEKIKPDSVSLVNGKLVYNKIEASGYEIEIVREVATVRSKTDIDVLLDGKPVAITLHVLQVWIWKDKEGWKLLSRQSVKM